MAVPAGRRRAADRHPIRYLNDGVSQDLFVDADGHAPRLAFPTPSRRAVFFARPHMDPRELPDDDFPFVLNTGRLQHQWHTMTKTGKVDKLNRLDSGPFVEIHPVDAVALGIVEGQPVEFTSRRGRAVLPAVVTDRVRPGNCFVPFHWNDEHGEYLTVNAVTNDAVDADSLQPEFKVCAVGLRPVSPSTPPPSWTWTGGPPRRIPKRSTWQHFSADWPKALTGVPVLPVSRACRGRRQIVDRRPAGRPVFADPAQRPADDAGHDRTAGAVGVADRHRRGLRRTAGPPPLGLTAWSAWTTWPPADLAAARDVLVITSTFGDGGPPDNGARFWDRLRRSRRAGP